MRRLVRIDLPQRLARTLPRPVTELLVGVIITLASTGVRAALGPLLDGGTPYAMTYLAIVVATLLAGWRSGLVALLLGQGLVWFVVLPGAGLTAGPAYWGLTLTTVAQALILFALFLYQREIKAGEIERQRRINFLGHALREMDHRTRNNFQIVVSMLQLQAGKASLGEVRTALNEAAERLKAVAAVYAALTPSSAGLGSVRLQDQLEEMCAQIRRGILLDGVTLETRLEPILVPHETAVAAGIVVNELITNACKHAFPDGRGTIVVSARKGQGCAVIEVGDDGRGLAGGTKAGGLGTRLIAAFVQRMKAKSEVRSSDAGTVHAITIPLG